MFNKGKISRLQERKPAAEGSFVEQFPMFVMVAPFVIFFFIFTIIPIFSSIFFSPIWGFSLTLSFLSILHTQVTHLLKV